MRYINLRFTYLLTYNADVINMVHRARIVPLQRQRRRTDRLTTVTA